MDIDAAIKARELREEEERDYGISKKTIEEIFSSAGYDDDRLVEIIYNVFKKNNEKIIPKIVNSSKDKTIGDLADQMRKNGII